MESAGFLNIAISGVLIGLAPMVYELIEASSGHRPLVVHLRLQCWFLCDDYSQRGSRWLSINSSQMRARRAIVK